jgi:hypothetical protein
VVYDAGLEYTVYCSGNRDCITRIAVEKVGGPVQRIHHPDQPGAQGVRQIRAEFFPYDHSVGISFP